MCFTTLTTQRCSVERHQLFNQRYSNIHSSYDIKCCVLSSRNASYTKVLLFTNIYNVNTTFNDSDSTLSVAGFCTAGASVDLKYFYNTFN